MEVAGLQQQQREEQERLGAGDHPGQAVFAAGLGGGEGEHGDADVGVQVLVVGVGVVGVVLGHPPAKADPDQQVAMDQPDQVVGPAAAEDLAVAGVVADKGQLGRHHGQVGGREQLPPRRTQQKEPGHADGQQAQVAAHPGPVPAATPLQQPSLLELPRQHRVLTPAALRRRQPSSERLIERGHTGSSGRRWNGGPGPGALRTAAALTGSAA
jgi:hypothetical protein